MKIALICLLVLCAACTRVDLANIEANAARNAPSPTPVNPLTSQQVLNAFKTANLPIADVVIYTDETDPNNLLGRPHQYVGKINFTDTRAKGKKQECTIEVFENKDDMESRKQYTDTISGSGGMFLKYGYAHKNALIRLPHQLLPKDAAAYETILKTL